MSEVTPIKPEPTEVETLKMRLFDSHRRELQAQLVASQNGVIAAQLQLKQIDAEQTAFADSIQARIRFEEQGRNQAEPPNPGPPANAIEGSATRVPALAGEAS